MASIPLVGTAQLAEIVLRTQFLWLVLQNVQHVFRLTAQARIRARAPAQVRLINAGQSNFCGFTHHCMLSHQFYTSSLLM